MKKRSFFHTVRVMFPMAFHAAPLRFILINVLGISQSVVMGANTLLLSNFVNELIASVGKCFDIDRQTVLPCGRSCNAAMNTRRKNLSHGFGIHGLLNGRA